MMKAIIIDDESLARDLVNRYLQKFEQIEVVASCVDGFSGFKAIQEHQPDLIFLDIQMPKITGFEMLELIEDPPMVIFSTAFDEYAIKAFEQNALDYLLKPYAESRFDEAVNKAIEKQKASAKNNQEGLTQAIASHASTLDRMVVKTGQQIHVLPIDQICHFEAQDDYVAIHAEEGKFLKLLRMKSLEAGLPKEDFVRIHRSHIVNVKAIDRLELYEKDSYRLRLKNGKQLPVSRSGHGKLKALLKF